MRSTPALAMSSPATRSENSGSSPAFFHFEFDRDPLRHHGLHDSGELSAPYKINRHPVIPTTLIGRLPNQAPCRRSAGTLTAQRPRTEWTATEPPAPCADR